MAKITFDEFSNLTSFKGWARCSTVAVILGFVVGLMGGFYQDSPGEMGEFNGAKNLDKLTWLEDTVVAARNAKFAV